MRFAMGHRMQCIKAAAASAADDVDDRHDMLLYDWFARVEATTLEMWIIDTVPNAFGSVHEKYWISLLHPALNMRGFRAIQTLQPQLHHPISALEAVRNAYIVMDWVDVMRAWKAGETVQSYSSVWRKWKSVFLWQHLLVVADKPLRRRGVHAISKGTTRRLNVGVSIRDGRNGTLMDICATLGLQHPLDTMHAIPRHILVSRDEVLHALCGKVESCFGLKPPSKDRNSGRRKVAVLQNRINAILRVWHGGCIKGLHTNDHKAAKMFVLEVPCGMVGSEV